MEKPGLVIERHENGQTFIEVDSLIEWFECQPDTGTEDSKILKALGEYAAFTLRSMKERAFKFPTRIMSEDEYKKSVAPQ